LTAGLHLGETMRAAVDLLKKRPGFRHLWFGNVISQLGDWIGWVAVAVLALHSGGGPLDVAVVFAAHHLPAALLTPVSGALADRFDRRRVLIVVSLLLAVTTAAMALAAVASSLAVLEGLLVLRSAMSAFFAPAERAVLPRVVERDELLLAGVFDAGSWSVVFSIGMALGGLLTMLGPTLALAIDAFTFLLAAAIFARLPPVRPDRGARPPKRVAMAAELAEALRYLGGHGGLRQAILAKGPLALAGGAAWLALTVNAEALLGAALGFGLLNAVRGVGAGLGPMMVVKTLGRGGDRQRVWSMVYAAGLAGMVAFALAETAVAGLLAAVVWGIGAGGNWVLSSERIAALGPDRLQARLNSIDLIAMLGGQTLGVVALAIWIDGGHSAASGVAILAGFALASWTLLSRGARTPLLSAPGVNRSAAH